MKYLLIPLAILAFVLFLIVLGAIGLAVSFAVISAVRGFWRMLTWGPRRRRERRAAKTPSGAS